MCVSSIPSSKFQVDLLALFTLFYLGLGFGMRWALCPLFLVNIKAIINNIVFLFFFSLFSMNGGKI